MSTAKDGVSLSMARIAGLSTVLSSIMNAPLIQSPPTSPISLATLSFARLAERVDNGVALISSSACVRYCNPAFARLVGRNVGALRGQLITQLMTDTSRLEFEHRMEERRRGDDSAYEITWTRPDGEVVHTYVTPWPLFDDSGEFEGSFAIIYDRTDHDRAATELNIARRIISGGSSILYRARLEDGFPTEYVSANVDRFGYSAEDFISGRITWPDILHDDDRARAIGEISAKVAAGASAFLQQYRIRTASGTVAWVEDHTIVQPRLGRSGFWLEGLITDVTDRHRSNFEMRQALAQTVRAIGSVVDRRDPYTGTHQRRVAALSNAIGQQMRLPPPQVEGLYLGALIHDLGKIAIPGEILGKPGRVTDEEYALLRTHVQAGRDILKDTTFPWPIIDIISQHHERLDGSGYPQGLTGPQIVLEARIVTVADVFEAMSEHRPYRPALGIPAALAELKAGRGTRYDELVVDACASVVAAHCTTATGLWAALDHGAGHEPTVVQRILDLPMPLQP